MSDGFMDLTPELAAEIDAMPCAMYREEPFPFAWCETHDTTFALGETCPVGAAQSPRSTPGTGDALHVPGVSQPL